MLRFVPPKVDLPPLVRLDQLVAEHAALMTGVTFDSATAASPVTLTSTTRALLAAFRTPWIIK